MLEQLLNLGRKIIPKPIFNFFQPAYHWFLAMLANLFYGFPSGKLKIIGVTGTDGKTTTTTLIASILEEAGFKVGMINGLIFKTGNKIWPNNLDITMPGRFQLQKLLSQMAKEKCDYVVLEVTSEGIAQNRILGIDFMTAVLTNVSPEHLNTHKTFENYLKTKGKLFERLRTQKNTEQNTEKHRKQRTQMNTEKNTEKHKKQKKIAVINVDDPNAKYFLSFPAGCKITYGIKKEADVMAKDIEVHSNFTKFILSGSYINLTYRLEPELPRLKPELWSLFQFDFQSDFQIHFLGKYNVYNALAAATVALALGINPETIKKGLEKIKKIPGRMEEIKINNGPRVFIDFAHTPQGLEAVFKTAKRMTQQRHPEDPDVIVGERRIPGIVPQGKLITVFGSAGGRDKIKRPLMGEVAAKLADFTILTTDDPRKEDPEEICREIEKGFERFFSSPSKSVSSSAPVYETPRGSTQIATRKNADQSPDNSKYKIIIDRKEAIAVALKMAKKEDVIIIAGMGASQWMHLGEKKIPWSDKEIVFDKMGEIRYT